MDDKNTPVSRKRKILLVEPGETKNWEKLGKLIFRKQSFALKLVLQFLRPREICKIATVNKAVERATWSRSCFPDHVWFETNKDKPCTFTWRRKHRAPLYVWKDLSPRRKKWLQPLIRHLYVRGDLTVLKGIQFPNLHTLALPRGPISADDQQILRRIARKIAVLTVRRSIPSETNFPEVRALWFKSKRVPRKSLYLTSKFPKLTKEKILNFVPGRCNYCRSEVTGSRCAGCAGPSYCSTKCQANDWERKHRHECFSSRTFYENLMHPEKTKRKKKKHKFEKTKKNV